MQTSKNAEPSPYIYPGLEIPRPSIDHIVRIVADCYQKTIDELQSGRRTDDLVRPRWVIYYICKQFGYKISQMFDIFYKDVIRSYEAKYTGIRNAIIKIEDWRKIYKDLQKELDWLDITLKFTRYKKRGSR